MQELYIAAERKSDNTMSFSNNVTVTGKTLIFVI